MKKAILLCFTLTAIACLKLSAQFCLFGKADQSESKNYKPCGGSKQSSKVIPFIETSYQLGLCGEKNPIAFITGIEKWTSKHTSITADVHFWKTDYEMWCDNMHTLGTYTAFIPSIKFKIDPGKKYSGFFVSAGIGYAIAKDRGTDQPYTQSQSSGVKTYTGNPTPGNWDFNSFAPNFSWGFSMKVFRFPVTLSNTNYFAKTGWPGWDGRTAPIATGIGLRLGLTQLPVTKSERTRQARNTHHRCCIKMVQKTGCGSKSRIEIKDIKKL